MKPFNPFNKSLDDLVTEDLTALKSINEGWYIEYKQEISSGESIAKSLSALANTYGGWLFYGIKEESKHNSVAGTFVGIPKNKIDPSLQAIRNSAAQHMNPTCHFDIKVIYGPFDPINLGSDSAIICVVVPQSQQAPHVHRSGRIYRRVADSSDPVPEADRYMLEKLFSRSEKKAEYYKKWHDRDPEFSKGESNLAFLRIMIEPNLWGTPRPPFTLSTDFVRKTLNPTVQRRCHIPFDTVYSRSGGFVARQCRNNDPSKLTLTWDVANDLSGDILIPLQTVNGGIEDIREYLYGYEHLESFLGTLISSNYERAHIIDFNTLIHILMSVIETQQTLQSLAKWPTGFNIKFKLINVWRTIPFVDVEYIVNHFKKNGLPLCLTSHITTPLGTEVESFIEIDDGALSTVDDLAVQSIMAFSWIAHSFGIPAYEMTMDEDLIDKEGKNIYHYFAEAGNRAIARTK
ncbi:helix-turn-helix domain-containing protein [Pseudomonas sp. P7548]|uniref:AlbA family DNA-binding domain-containing protein n=1 Tax=Pseudomonas sp. P7548 TaxID=2726981 RepID=UPI0015BEA603|nr:ATP-binding protein [Pseudomonas sp. P7548]NWE20183.1 ATP-binding protein [Pseudomonas sp. P7548]